MSDDLNPRLRPLEAFPVQHDGQELICLRDPEGFADAIAMLPRAAALILAFFDGEHSVRDVQAEILRRGGPLVPSDHIRQMLERLDEAYLLDSPRFQAHRQARIQQYLASPVRPPAHAGGAYAAQPDDLRRQLESLFTGEGGPGLPAAPDGTAETLRGVLSPHIDLHRGGPTFAWAYKHLAEGTDAEVFVIFGTAHHPTRRRFALTRKDFAIPLGTVSTDRRFIEILEELCGPELFDDEYAHAHEHSIEFQVLFLQYLLGPRRLFRVVPILVGSFHEFVAERKEPLEDPEIARFLDAIRDAEHRCGAKVCYISGGDLAHVGLRFGDAHRLSDDALESLRRADLDLLSQAELGDPRRFFAQVARDRDQRRICGFPPTYTLMAVVQPKRGQLLKYDQAVDPNRTSCVSFASVAFYAD